ncbi:peptidase S24/S26A/S26B/S26C [Polychytrium aggregatum]|uniref:peptidase S24/S26A/S26B/S26C n=1 Tax=Polychytrium aggregatum TaxID=110093 RepID=UPI0022FDB1B7|nr:peptidase S24/S26A/S26B/S26C [Polychytrium aggregatum]KAI9204019.1 peptidase S24/S26A/S26B/S26C [Polychytrium aggregatum]
MLPTFNFVGDWVVVEFLSSLKRDYKFGDVVVAVSPLDPKRAVCKRILGLPGDIVCVDPTHPYREYIQVPQGHVWLQGDNFTNSTDSRCYGPVPMGLLTGKVLCKVWPNFEWMR